LFRKPVEVSLDFQKLNPFDPEGWRTLCTDTFPERPGIYVLSVFKDGFFYALYVGRTSNLRRRIKEHWLVIEMIEFACSTGSSFPVICFKDQSENLVEDEARFIKRLRPLLNSTERQL
jgi:excinuclease UvrABC nuclease subunit